MILQKGIDPVFAYDISNSADESFSEAFLHKKTTPKLRKGFHTGNSKKRLKNFTENEQQQTRETSHLRYFTNGQYLC